MPLYDYGNTRLRARISNFFSIHTLESFADLTSIDSLISQLSKSHYKKSIESSLTHAHGMTCIMQAIRQEYSNIRFTLERYYDPALWEKIQVIFLRADVQNVKSVFRGIAHNAGIDTIINSLSPLGINPENMLTSIARSKNIQEAIDKTVVFGLGFADDLIKLKTPKELCESSEIERTLELWYFNKIGAILSSNDENTKLIRKLNIIEADIVNLNILLRFVNAPSSPDLENESIGYYLIDGCSFSRDLFLKLSRETTVKNAISHLPPNPYNNYLLEALSQYEETGLLSVFENKMRMYKLKWLSQLPKQHPFGIGVPMGYVALKESEIRNIRWIAKGIYSGFKPDFIKNNIENFK